MYKISRLLLFVFILPFSLSSQVLPKEDVTLNYRLVGFSFPTGQKANSYKIEIATGSYNSEDSFKKNIVLSLNSKTDKIIAEIPYFGKQYTWRAVYTSNDSTAISSPLHHFSTGILQEVDTSINRLWVTIPTEKYKDDFVLLDANKALYDMNGRPLWYLPDIKGMKTNRTIFCDLKITPQHTITFMNDEGLAFEVNYNGTVLWRGPNNDNINKYTTYHHELTRLSNGRYMVLGFEKIYFKAQRPPTIKDDTFFDSTDKVQTINALNEGYKKDAFGTIIEYDEQGNIVWSWKTSQYVKGSDLYNFTPTFQKHRYDVHENSFYFDEKNKVIYVSLRNISRIVKIQYPSGKVLANYGEIYKPGVASKGNDLFCGQHSVRLSKKGYVYVYNNNICNHSGHMPTVIMLQEPTSKNGKLKKIWEYECTIEDPEINSQKDFGTTTGGNVLEMPDNSMFVSMSNQYSKLFIVGLDKKILWSALPLHWNGGAKHWDVIPQYRASIITRKELEDLVWNGEK